MPRRPLVSLLACLAACGGALPARHASRARRIVSLLPSFTEIVVALGAGDRLVGCTGAGRPGRRLPRVPWQGASAAEAILRLSPDLVLRQRVRAQSDPLKDALERAGIPVLTAPSETVEDVRADIVAIGRAIHRSPEATALLRRFDSQMRAARASVAGKPRPRVLFVYGRSPGAAANVSAAGPGSFLDELIRYAGGRNALEDLDTPYASPSLEEIVRKKPEVIIDNAPPEKTLAAVRAAWSRLSPVPAVRDGRVYAVFDPTLLIPGPRLPQAVRRLAEMIHGTP